MADVDRGRRATRTSTRKHLALPAMLFAVSMTFIDQTIVAIAAPELTQELSLSRAGASGSSTTRSGRRCLSVQEAISVQWLVR